MNDLDLTKVNNFIESVGKENVIDIIVIAEGATNSDVLGVTFPKLEIKDIGECMQVKGMGKGVTFVSKDWLEKPYKQKGRKK